MNNGKIVAIALAVVVLVFVGIRIGANYTAEKRVKEVVAELSPYMHVSYDKVRVALPSREMRVSNVEMMPTVGGEKINIEEVLVRRFDDNSDFPQYLSMALKGVEMDLSGIDPSLAQAMTELGYGSKTFLNFGLDYSYNLDKQELELKDLSLGLREMGEVSLALHLSNINLQPEAMLSLLFSYPEIMLNSLELNYKDNSLADRLIGKIAEESGLSPEDFKGMISAMIDEDIAGESDPVLLSAMNSVKKFINDPKFFTIRVSPDTARSFEEIIETEEIKELVGILNVKIDS